jgi:hypothetical protein
MEGDESNKSSAYITQPMKQLPTRQPSPLPLRLTIISSTYTLNRIGDKIPPWRTHDTTLDSSLYTEFHLREESNLLYQQITLIKHTGSLRGTNLSRNVKWSFLSKDLLASTAVKKTELSLEVKYFTTCCTLNKAGLNPKPFLKPICRSLLYKSDSYCNKRQPSKIFYITGLTVIPL